ncbi:Dabb family protein [bacterium]|nr:Dabb family protein [Planctomycetales bacterium]MCB1155481.1 Dabb family protein [bacterium]
MLSHIVFFNLKDNTADARQALVDACREHLDGHEGTVFFAVGTRTPDLQREVNDQTFDVALHVIFATRENQDAYQTDPRHLKFIAENRDNWAQVRVFDSDC